MAWLPYYGILASFQTILLHDCINAGPFCVLVNLIHLEGSMELKLLQYGQCVNKKIILLHGIKLLFETSLCLLKYHRKYAILIPVFPIPPSFQQPK